MAAPSSILSWEVPWTEEPGGSQSTGSQRVSLDLATKQQTKTSLKRGACHSRTEESERVSPHLCSILPCLSRLSDVVAVLLIKPLYICEKWLFWEK